VIASRRFGAETQDGRKQMRTIKLAIAALAALAVMAAGAAGAQAANFTAASYPALVSGEPSGAGAPSLTFEGGKTAKCETVGFGGEITKATGNLNLGPGFTGCTNFGAAGTIATNGCEFVFHPGAGAADKFSGTFDITCPVGKTIVVTGSTCEVQIGAQTGLTAVAYERLTAVKPNEVQANFSMKSTAGFAYTKTVDGASCGLSGVGAKTDGVIGGGLKIKAGDPKTLEPITFAIE
jgi:hypothetical protein